MRRNLVIAILIILIAAGGGVWWFSFGRGGGGGAPSQEEGAPEEQGFVGKIADALKLGKAMKCTWTKEGDTATFHVKGNKYYGEATVEGQKTSYIMRDNCTYFWQEGKTQGFKWCWTPEEAERLMAEFEKGEAGVAMGYQYSCQPAVVSDSLFTLPSGVEFMDLSEYME